MPGGDRPSHLAAIGIALFVTVLWSSSWVLIRWGLDGEGLEPITFAALRYGLAAVVVVVWMVIRDRPSGPLLGLDRSTGIQIVALGVLMYTVTQGAQFIALDSQPAATTSLVLSLTPLLVAGLAVVSLAEVPSSRQLVGTILVAAGAWLFFVGDLGATAAGIVAAAVSLGANVASALLGRHINRQAALPCHGHRSQHVGWCSDPGRRRACYRRDAVGLCAGVADHRVACGRQYCAGVYAVESVAPAIDRR